MKISDALQHYLVSSFEREDSLRERKYYISDMGKCPRMRWIKRKGVNVRFEPHVYWILQLGNLIHDYGYKALQSQELLLESESSFSTDQFSGRFDGLIKDGTKKAVFDFKSAGGYKMGLIRKGNDDQENISQVLASTLILKEQRKDISDTAYVVYINKEPGEKNPVNFFQKEYHLTSWNIKNLTEEMTTMAEYWDKDKIPACTCVGWQKDYNSYLPFCNAPEKEIRKLLEYIKTGKKLISTKTSITLVDGETKKEVLKI